MKVKIDRISVLLLAAAVVLGLALERQNGHRVQARQWIGPSLQIVPLKGPPAFRSNNQAVLFFETKGVEGPLHGAVVITGEKIENVFVTVSSEGIDRRALHDDRDFLQSFSGKAARSPLVVDAISGATISSQLVINAVSERLQQWEHHIKNDERNGRF